MNWLQEIKLSFGFTDGHLKLWLKQLKSSKTATNTATVLDNYLYFKLTAFAKRFKSTLIYSISSAHTINYVCFVCKCRLLTNELNNFYRVASELVLTN